MKALKIIIDAVIALLSVRMDIFGYNITLMGVAVFCVLGSLLLGFVFKMFK